MLRDTRNDADTVRLFRTFTLDLTDQEQVKRNCDGCGRLAHLVPRENGGGSGHDGICDVLGNRAGDVAV
ncbi:hypothetical protein PG997_012297 [Apiospora hydei]|uniref:Uncharacterized protein n=1 Tax=Apiospora hydei TaxID=1337664 RepID=A0ABR1V2Z2_9PEZI